MSINIKAINWTKAPREIIISHHNGTASKFFGDRSNKLDNDDQKSGVAEIKWSQESDEIEISYNNGTKNKYVGVVYLANDTTSDTGIISGISANSVADEILIIYNNVTKTKYIREGGVNKINLAKNTGVVTGVGVGSAATAAIGGTAGLSAAGFTSAGISAGSYAASYQSAIGCIAAGSKFATLQSIGAAGGLGLLGPVGITAGLIGCAATIGYFWYRKQHTMIKAINWNQILDTTINEIIISYYDGPDIKYTASQIWK